MKPLLLVILLLIASLRPALATPVQGNNQFAWSLYARLAQSKGNVFFSPFSISSALAMTYAGARGQTATEMANVLHFPPKDGHAQWGELLKNLLQPNKGYQFSLANRIWPNRAYRMRQPFLSLVQSYYQSTVEQLNYGDSEGARKTINDWVASQTQGKIQDLIASGVLTDRTRLVLTNAIYFKGTWQSAFQESATQVQPFTSADGKKSPCHLMHQQGSFDYAQVDSVQVLEMPYAGDRLTLTVLLPTTPKALPALEKKLAAADWQRWTAGLSHQLIDVHFPRYKVTQEFQLNKFLKQLGMGRVFDPKQSDLSGLCEDDTPLWISAVIHKAFIEVNEKGTEAAAATAVVVMEGRAAHVEPKPILFRADHTFVYAIRDRQTGSILFLGRLDRP